MFIFSKIGVRTRAALSIEPQIVSK